ncbi:MAG: phosphoribosylformylglycinamidine synthase, partial [Sphaerochaeta sp.]
MVYRLFVEKKEGFRIAEEALLSDLKQVVGIAGLQGVRLFNRYDIQGIDASLLEQCKHTVFCEVQVDTLYETFPLMPFDAFIVAVEYLPGQFDQRSDSAAQCIQLISTNERPLIRSAKVYCLQGVLSQEDKMKIKEYLINPVESREADLDLPLDLLLASDEPEQVSIIDGFIDLDDRDLEAFHCKESLAMDVADL